MDLQTVDEELCFMMSIYDHVHWVLAKVALEEDEHHWLRHLPSTHAPHAHSSQDYVLDFLAGERWPLGCVYVDGGV